MTTADVLRQLHLCQNLQMQGQGGEVSADLDYLIRSFYEHGVLHPEMNSTQIDQLAERLLGKSFH